ncbi:MAG: cysteine hydrolase [Anaerolineae bacterium]|nr:cysteine hydrolase [Anaerolineae bacterium]
MRDARDGQGGELCNGSKVGLRSSRAPVTRSSPDAKYMSDRCIDAKAMLPRDATLDNSVLLVIDVINSCAHQKYEDPERDIRYNKVRQMIPSLSSFITAFKQLGGRIILTTTVPWQEVYLADNINELYRNDPEARYWSEEAGGDAEQFYEIPTDGAIVFVKNSYDAFTNTALVETLQEMGIRYIIITGIFGDGCVLATICGGFSRGYRFIIVEDLIETTDDEDRQALQRHLKQRMWPLMYGATVKSYHILSAFSRRTIDVF